MKTHCWNRQRHILQPWQHWPALEEIWRMTGWQVICTKLCFILISFFFALIFVLCFLIHTGDFTGDDLLLQVQYIIPRGLPIRLLWPKLAAHFLDCTNTSSTDATNFWHQYRRCCTDFAMPRVRTVYNTVKATLSFTLTLWQHWHTDSYEGLRACVRKSEKLRL